MSPLILASGSPYRLKLLQEAGIDVIACPSEYPEPPIQSFSNMELGLKLLANFKAWAVGTKFPDAVILGCDTVSIAGEVLGKPRDRDDAERMLRLLSGTVHSVWTGYCLFRTQDQLALSGVDKTEIEMRAWTESEIETYLDGGEWQGKCGGYALEILQDPFVTRIRGSAANVIGVPLERLQMIWDQFPSFRPNPPRP